MKMNRQQTSVQERFVSGPLKFLSYFSVSPAQTQIKTGKKTNILSTHMPKSPITKQFFQQQKKNQQQMCAM